MQTFEIDNEIIKIIFDDFIKKNARKLVVKMHQKFDCLLYDIKSNLNFFNEKRIRIKITRSSKFLNKIIIYNNVLFFINEFVKMNHIHNEFNTFRCMSDIKYLIDVLLINFDDNLNFAQIYIMNEFQKQLKRRMKNDIDDNVLNLNVLQLLQRLMRNIHFYARAFKSCAQRLVDNFNSMIKIYLKQNDFNKLIKEIYNKFTSNEIIV